MKKELLPFIMAANLVCLKESSAQLIASENFNYTLGSIVGQNGGTGWSSAWLTTTFNTANTMIAASGLAKPPEVIGVGNQNHQVGNDFRNFRFLDTTSVLALSLMDSNGDPGAGSGQNYHWGKGYGKDGTTIWVSFLFYRSNNTQGYGGMHLMYGMNLSFDQYGDKKSHQRFQFGADNSHTKYMLSRTINGNSNLPSTCGQTVQSATTVNGTLHLLVQRIDFKPGAETGYLWIDPITCQQPDTALADVKMYGICDFRFNAVNIGGGSNANYEMDELRIGVGYNDVVNCSSTGLNEFEPLLSQKFVFPNPSNGNFNVRFANETVCNATIIVSDMLGQTVLLQKIKLEAGNNSVQLLADKIESGSYIISLRTENGISVKQKLIIEK